MKTRKRTTTTAFAALIACVATLAACEQTVTEPPDPGMDDIAVLIDQILDAPTVQAERAAQRLAERLGTPHLLGTPLLGTPLGAPVGHVAADGGPRCHVLEPATREERDAFQACLVAAFADPECDAYLSLLWAPVPDTELWDIVGAVVICRQ